MECEGDTLHTEMRAAEWQQFMRPQILIYDHQEPVALSPAISAGWARLAGTL